jgi:hypothetical protein
MNRLLTIIIILFNSTVFGQNGSNKVFEIPKGQLSLPSRAEEQSEFFKQNYNKTTGDTLWSEDFTNGFPAGWSVYDSTGNNAVWGIQPAGTLPDANFTITQPTIASASGGNCMLLYSDLYNSPGPSNAYYEMNSYFQTSAIAVNNRPGITVEFQQSFRWCCDISASTAVLSVSIDPTFATNVQDFDIKGGVGNNLFSPDPMNMSINISAIAANYVGDIYLRFHVKSGISAYYWMIDDIIVVESPLNDIQVSNGFYGFDGYQYTRIPQSQIQPMDFSIQSINNGSVNQPGTNFTVDINDGTSSVFNGSSNDTTINSLSNDTFRLNNFWTPPTWIVQTPYTVTLNVFSDSTDISPNNNSTSFPPFKIMDAFNAQLAMDDFSPTPGNGGGSPGPNGVTEYEAGNYFKIFNSTSLFGIEVVTGNNTPIGTFIDVVIYEIDFSTAPEVYSEVWRSPGYAIQAFDIGNPLFFSNGSLSQMAFLAAGKTYFAGVHSYIDYEYAVSGTNPFLASYTKTHSAIRYPSMANPNTNSSFNLIETPMIRLKLDLVTDIESSKSEIKPSVSPNPTNGLFTFEFLSESFSGIFYLSNAYGKEVFNQSINSSSYQIDVSHLSKGIYFYRYRDNKQSYAGKLVIN